MILVGREGLYLFLGLHHLHFKHFRRRTESCG